RGRRGGLSRRNGPARAPAGGAGRGRPELGRAAAPLRLVGAVREGATELPDLDRPLAVLRGVVGDLPAARARREAPPLPLVVSAAERGGASESGGDDPPAPAPAPGGSPAGEAVAGVPPLEWSTPDSIVRWAKVFRVGRNKMATLLKT